MTDLIEPPKDTASVYRLLVMLINMKAISYNNAWLFADHWEDFKARMRIQDDSF